MYIQAKGLNGLLKFKKKCKDMGLRMFDYNDTYYKYRRIPYTIEEARELLDRTRDGTGI